MFNQLLLKDFSLSNTARIRTHITFEYETHYVIPEDQLVRSIAGIVIYVSTDITSYSLEINDFMNLGTWEALIERYKQDPSSCSMGISLNSLFINKNSREKLVDLILHKVPDQLIWEEDEDIETQEEEYYYV